MRPASGFPKVALIGLLLLAGLQANAQVATQYSISAVKCPGSARLLDFHEGATLRGYRYDERSSLDQILERLRSRMPDRAAGIKQGQNEFQRRLKPAKPGSLGITPERDRIVAPPPGCEFRTVLRAELGGREIHVDPELWKALSPLDQTGAFIHWALATEAHAAGETLSSSIYLRVLVSHIPTRELSQLPTPSLVEILRKAQLPSLRIQGVLTDLRKELRFDSNGIMRLGTPIPGSSWIHPTGASLRLKADPMQFHEGGAVSRVRFEDELSLPVGRSRIPFSTPDSFSSAPFPEEQRPSLYLFADGGVRKGITTRKTLLETQNVRLRLANGRTRFERLDHSLIVLFPGGDLALATQVSGEIQWNEKWVPIEPNSSVSFHPSRPPRFKELMLQGKIPLRVQDMWVNFTGHLLLEEDGRLRCGHPAQPVVLLNSQGQKVKIETEEQICFDSSSRAQKLVHPPN